MTAFQSIRLSAQGAPETPNGGSDESLLKSLIRRRRHDVDCDPPEAGSVSTRLLTNEDLERSLRSRKGRQTDHVDSSRGSGSNRRWVRGGVGKDVVWGRGPYSKPLSRWTQTTTFARNLTPSLLLLASPSVVQHVAQNVPLGQHSVRLEAPVAASGTPPVVVLDLLPSRRRHDPDDQGRGCHAARRDPAQDRRCESSLSSPSIRQDTTS